MNNLMLITMLGQWTLLSQEDKDTFLQTIGATTAPIVTAAPTQPQVEWTKEEIEIFEEYYNKGRDANGITAKISFWAKSNKTMPEVKRKYDEYKALGL